MMRILSGTLALAALLVLPACGGSGGSGPVGKWKLDASGMKAYMEKQMKEMAAKEGAAPGMADMMKGMMEGMMKQIEKSDMCIELKAGGAVVGSGKDPEGKTIDAAGTWTEAGGVVTIDIKEDKGGSMKAGPQKFTLKGSTMELVMEGKGAEAGAPPLLLRRQ